MKDINEILKKAIEQDASDIFIVAGSPCAFKIKGEIQRVDDERLMPKDCKLIIEELYKYAPYGQNR